MRRTKSFENDGPALYIIATPIGNMADITLRAIEVLKQVDVIFAEDTRVSGHLLKHHGIDTPLRSYYAHNEREKSNEALGMLSSGKQVALISDAGTPRLSDPGDILVRTIRDNNFPVVPIPGASALLSALMISALPAETFTFVGFLPHKTSAKETRLKSLVNVKHSLVFYETPHRIEKTLNSMYDLLGNRQATLMRELTKQHEEVIEFTLGEAATLDNLRGEMVLIVEGNTETSPLNEDDMIDHVELLIEDGYNEKDAIKHVASTRNVKKNTVYMAYQTYKKRTQSKE